MGRRDAKRASQSAIDTAARARIVPDGETSAEPRVSLAQRMLPPALLVIATVALLLPFINKPLHVDDPMYIWPAQHITESPGNPYGFDVTWSMVTTPMWEEMKNPPGVSYYIALMATLLGWSEIALHAAMLLPNVLTVLGTYFVARELGMTRPRATLAAAAMLATPVFLVSATTIMCDVPMLCLFIWAIWFWVRGVKRDSLPLTCIAGLLIAAATLTKYFGIALFPLLIVYAIARTRRPWGRWLIALLIPALILTGYHFWTKHLYGRSLLSDAVGFASVQRWGKPSEGSAAAAAIGVAQDERTLRTFISGLAFAGGCCATVILLAWAQVSRRTWIIGAVVLIAAVALLALIDPFPKFRIRGEGGMNWSFLIQLGGWSFAGLSLLIMTAVYWWRVRSADAMLVALWLLGTFAFAVFVNWTVAGRSVLPMAPAAAIIAASWPARRAAESTIPLAAPVSTYRWCEWATVGVGLLLALVVAFADQALARTGRDAAAATIEAYRQHVKQPRDIWFTGHWGFQAYMHRLGAKILNRKKLAVVIGDAYIVPNNNVNLIIFPRNSTFVVANLEFPPLGFCSTMSGGAFFYAHLRGPLPFVFGRVPAEKYRVEVINESMIGD